jgi:integrase
MSRARKTSFGRVTVTPSGPYFRIRWRQDGRARERSTTSFEEACRIAREVDAAIAVGGHASPDGSFAAVADAAMHRNRFPRYADESYDNLRSVLRIHIIPVLGSRQARSVRRQDCQEILDNLLLGKGMSKHTVGKVRAVLVHVGNYGVEQGVWTPAQNPATGIAIARGSSGEENDVQLGCIADEDIPSDEQVAALLEAAWADSPRNGFILEVAARSGLRWSEVMGLKASDFDFESRELWVKRARRERRNGTFYLKAPKTKAGWRKTVIAAESVERLRSYVDRFDADDFLTLTREHTPLRRTNFTRPMTRYRAASGYPEHMSVHSLRHHFGTRAIRLGVAIADVSSLLGHSSPLVTMGLYVHGDASSVTRAQAIL